MIYFQAHKRYQRAIELYDLRNLKQHIQISLMEVGFGYILPFVKRNLGPALQGPSFVFVIIFAFLKFRSSVSRYFISANI